MQPVDGDTLFPFTIPQLDTGRFVKAAILLPPGKTILAYTKMMSHNDFLRIFGKVNKIDTRYVKNSLEDWEKSWPPIGRLAGESYLYVEDFGYDGEAATAIHPSQLEVSVSDIDDWLSKADWSRLL